ncbi:MAG TPA: metal-sensitive transcriptional regulator [Jatrophihabitans sp.]|nr:metal-sensitive transcriptional regulator [Jatrophihabitans sp.]
MQVEAAATEELVKRLRRVEGQIGGIIRMLEEGRDCTDIVTQVAAASKALDRAGFKLLATGMRQCLTAPSGDGSRPMTPDEMEKLFLTLA